MLEFGQDIRWVTLMIIEMNSDLHLHGKLILRPVKATCLKYAERLFYSVTKSNIEM